MLYMPKEATNKDDSLKIRMMVSLKGDLVEKSTEKIWKFNGFFGDHRTDLAIMKANFPENTLIFVNNGSISAVKGGQTAIYLDYFILAQILSLINSPEVNLDNQNIQYDEVLLHVPLYNTENGLNRGLKKSLASIVLRGDEMETFYSYGFDKRKIKNIVL